MRVSRLKMFVGVVPGLVAGGLAGVIWPTTLRADAVAPSLADTRTTYYHSDVTGNVRAESNDAGTLTATHRYEPFGLTIPQEALSTEAPRFSGKLRDPVSGLDDFGARHFAGEYGRFLATDPIAFASKQFGNPQDLNLYGYALNNPLKYVDPNGAQARNATLDWLFGWLDPMFGAAPPPTPGGLMSQAGSATVTMEALAQANQALEVSTGIMDVSGAGSAFLASGQQANGQSDALVCWAQNQGEGHVIGIGIPYLGAGLRFAGVTSLRVVSMQLRSTFKQYPQVLAQMRGNLYTVEGLRALEKAVREHIAIVDQEITDYLVSLNRLPASTPAAEATSRALFQSHSLRLELQGQLDTIRFTEWDNADALHDAAAMLEP